MGKKILKYKWQDKIFLQRHRNVIEKCSSWNSDKAFWEKSQCESSVTGYELVSKLKQKTKCKSIQNLCILSSYSLLGIVSDAEGTKIRKTISVLEGLSNEMKTKTTYPKWLSAYFLCLLWFWKFNSANF